MQSFAGPASFHQEACIAIAYLFYPTRYKAIFI